MAIGDDQGLAPVDAEDHPRSDRLAAEEGYPDGSLDEHIGPHGALEGRFDLLDHREVGGRLGVEQVGSEPGMRQELYQDDGPANEDDDPHQETGSCQPDPALGVDADMAHRHQGEHDGD